MSLKITLFPLEVIEVVFVLSSWLFQEPVTTLMEQEKENRVYWIPEASQCCLIIYRNKHTEAKMWLVKCVPSVARWGSQQAEAHRQVEQ